MPSPFQENDKIKSSSSNSKINNFLNEEIQQINITEKK
jgi:hypothetical protein